MRTLPLISLAVALAAGPASAQDPRGQLLPGSVTSGIQVQWRQDGRVVEYTLRNNVATWVVTETKLIVEFSAPELAASPPPLPQPTDGPKPKSGKAASSPLDALIVSGVRYQGFKDEAEVHVTKLVVRPSGESSSRLELKSSGKVLSVRVEEARGREPTFLENVRNMVR